MGYPEFLTTAGHDILDGRDTETAFASEVAECERELGDDLLALLAIARKLGETATVAHLAEHYGPFGDGDFDALDVLESALPSVKQAMARITARLGGAA